MTFTYSSVELSTTLAQVRRLIGDTDSSDPQLTDEEITFFTTANGNVYFAAAAACDAISASYARKVTKSVGPLSIQFGDRQGQYEALAKKLRYQGALGTTPYAGGISLSDKTTVENDTDRWRPNFLIGMDDKPGTGVGRPSAGSSS